MSDDDIDKRARRLAKQRERARERRALLRESGRCISCGKPVEEHYVTCVQCGKRSNAYKSLKKQKQREALTGMVAHCTMGETHPMKEAQVENTSDMYVEVNHLPFSVWLGDKPVSYHRYRLLAELWIKKVCIGEFIPSDFTIKEMSEDDA